MCQVSSRVVESGAVEVTVHMEDSVVTGCYVGMVLATDKHVILREVIIIFINISVVLVITSSLS